MYSELIWPCPFPIIVSKPYPNGCDIFWSIHSWRHIERWFESGRRSESYISLEEKLQIFTHHFVVAGIIQQPGKFLLPTMQFSVSFAGESCVVLTRWFTFRRFNSRRHFQNERGTQSKHNICMSSIFTGETSFDLSLFLWGGFKRIIKISALKLSIPSTYVSWVP